MAEVIATIKLAPGVVGIFDPLTRIHLMISNPTATVYAGMNTENLVYWVKSKKATLVSGSLTGPVVKSEKPKEDEAAVLAAKKAAEEEAAKKAEAEAAAKAEEEAAKKAEEEAAAKAEADKVAAEKAAAEKAEADKAEVEAAAKAEAAKKAEEEAAAKDKAATASRKGKK